MTEVTIIIPNYNGKKLLENCIKTLERQTCQEFKLLVIDNGSKDGSTDVTSESLDMEMVALPENTGFCGAVNLGFEMTTTPYAILLNNDTEAEPHFVEELLQGIRQSERIFSCGAQMLDFKQRELLDNAGDLYTLPSKIIVLSVQPVILHTFNQNSASYFWTQPPAFDIRRLR